MLFNSIFAVALLAAPAFAAPHRHGGSHSKRVNLWETLPATPALPGNPVGTKVPVNNIELWYAEFGTKSAVPVVLLHGGLGNSNWFGAVIEKLMVNHYVIAIDTRGQGRSTMDGAAFTYDLFASDTAALLKSKGIAKAAYVGWSDGGNTALATLKNPAIASFVDRAYIYGANHNIAGLNPTFDASAIYKEFVKRATAEWQSFQVAGADITPLYTAIGEMSSTLPAYTAADLSTITLGAKLTVADGEYEEAIKIGEAAAIQAAIPNSKLEILKGVSHFGAIQDPVQFAASVEAFLTAV